MAKIKVGIIGIGGAAGMKMHLPVIRQMDNLEAVAGFDTREDFPGKDDLVKNGIKIYHDINDFLTKGGMDIVHVCTPSGYHVQGAIAAVVKRKPVIIEKPIGITLDSIDDLIRIKDETGVWVSGWFQNRSSPHIARLRKFIESEEVYGIKYIQSSTPWFRRREYFFEDGACTKRNWKGTYEIDGGGAMMNQAIHYVDFVTWLLELDEQSVIAVENGVAQRNMHHYIKAEDTAYVRLIFGADGVERGNGEIEARTTEYCGKNKKGKDRERPQTLYVQFTNGAVTIKDGSVVAVTWDGKNQLENFGETIKTGGGGADPTTISLPVHLAHMEEIYDAFRNNREPPVTLESARKPVELIIATYKSAKENGARVELPLQKPYFVPDESIIQNPLIK